MSRRKSATPKERVLAVEPYAQLEPSDTGVAVYSGPLISSTWLGHGRTASRAWADAAKRLRGTGKKRQA
jgi:hypothetical protein